MEIIIQHGIDIMLVLILIISVIVSMQKGFLKCILSLACVAVALIAASALNESVAEWCYENIVSGFVVDKVESAISNGFNSESAAATVQATIDMLPEFIITHLDNIGFDISSVSNAISGLELSPEDTAIKISEEIIRPGVLILMRMLCYILIFIIVRFALGLICKLISGVTKLPVLKQANKFLGAAVGLIKGIMLVFLLATLLNFLFDITKNDNGFAQAIENSHICVMIEELDSPESQT